MYSFYCKDCGDSFFDTDKEKVKNYRDSHKIKFYNSKVCPMQLTDRGTLARPKLAILINEQIKEEA